MSATNSTRKHVRFDPDMLDNASIGIFNDLGEYVPLANALIINEAPMSGCCLVTYRKLEVNVGKVYGVKLGSLNPVRAEIRWFQPINTCAVKIGFRFLE